MIRQLPCFVFCAIISLWQNWFSSYFHSWINNVGNTSKHCQQIKLQQSESIFLQWINNNTYLFCLSIVEANGISLHFNRGIRKYLLNKQRMNLGFYSSTAHNNTENCLILSVHMYIQKHCIWNWFSFQFWKRMEYRAKLCHVCCKMDFLMTFRKHTQIQSFNLCNFSMYWIRYRLIENFTV